MTKRRPADVAASIRQRLSNHARATGRPFQEVLQYFAMERFLYRLSQSDHADKFVLKGALMFTVWRSPSSRPTNDIAPFDCADTWAKVVPIAATFSPASAQTDHTIRNAYSPPCEEKNHP